MFSTSVSVWLFVSVSGWYLRQGKPGFEGLSVVVGKGIHPHQ